MTTPKETIRATPLVVRLVDPLDVLYGMTSEEIGEWCGRNAKRLRAKIRRRRTFSAIAGGR